MGFDLKPHQKSIIDGVIRKNINRILFYHEVGTGKTITSLGLAYKYWSQKERDLIIVTPVSIMNNFEREMKSIKSLYKQSIKNVTLLTYAKYLKKVDQNSGFVDNKIVIVDEIHNFRNTGKTTTAMIKSLKNAARVILLSATPIVNNPMDLIPILAILNRKKYGEIDISDSSLYADKISYYTLDMSTDKDKFPKVNHFKTDIYMNMEYYNDYIALESEQTPKLPENFQNKDISAFFNGMRRGVNKIFNRSGKIDWVIEHIKRNPKRKILVYSAWKDAGLNLIFSELDDKVFKYCIITGDVSKRQRDSIVKDYNDKTINILGISSAGSEGLDLKETNDIIILEPHWNNQKIRQIIGRGVRYNSHINLPEKERFVNVYLLLLQKPKDIPILQRAWYFFVDSGNAAIDQWMLTYANKKEKENNAYLQKLKDFRI